MISASACSFRKSENFLFFFLHTCDYPCDSEEGREIDIGRDEQ